ncbi:Gamma-cadinene synthase [Sesamum alatum]|uniref:Gamma-cadinene synthase n=1 Tax=Sesamum alatum TaxID=300844 RepID=A0AAE1YU99_9LAMI|nr:Gamma-cadinene synthase [Sesamum alatum]
MREQQTRGHRGPAPAYTVARMHGLRGGSATCCLCGRCAVGQLLAETVLAVAAGAAEVAIMADWASTCRRDVRPPMATYSPSLWGDIFSTFSFDHQVQERCGEAIEALKSCVRSILRAAKSGKLIALIDKLERLGLAYHFETDIEEKLQEIYINVNANSGNEDDDYDLFTTALRFRLLRQHRFHVSCSVFDKFTNKDHKFKEHLSSDTEGLLSLYEAAHARIHGEDVLEEAVAFTTHHLSRMLQQLDQSPLKDKVKRALEQALHRGVPIIETRIYLSIYERDESRDELLLKLAKLNFSFLQNLYRKELCEVSRWWNKFDLKTKLPYARDRLIECYLWGVSVHFEPQYSDVRIAVAKSMQMVSTMDDTYDNYATLEEADLLTDILERWDINEIGPLPDYMKIFYRFVMSIYEDYEREAAKQGMLFAVPYFRETVKQLGRAYNQELKWVMEREMPTFEDYFKNSVITSCIYVMFTALVPGMKSITKETIDWLLSEPNIVISTARMGRHLEDLGSHERENKGGKMLTVVDCYMQQHGVSKQETLAKFAELVEDGWKNVNRAWVGKTPAAKEMVEQLLNYARIAEVTYKNSQDGYTNPDKFLAPQIAALFVDPILV